jgi:hypothetical protein
LNGQAQADENQLEREYRIGRTTWHSAVVPGWGQLDNKKWWKVPLVYGGLGAAGYFIHTEGGLYRGYRDGYLALTDDDPTTLYATEFDTQTVRDLRDFHRSNFEQSILMFVLIWGAQVVDAHVDAHLLGFDVSEDLGWVPGAGPTVGLKLSHTIVPRRFSRIR